MRLKTNYREAVTGAPGWSKKKVVTALLAALTLLTATGWSSPGKGHPKLAKDVQKASGKPQKITVIVQFKVKPTQKHYQALSEQGTLNNKFDFIKAATVTIPASALPALEKNPDVAYVTIDRLIKPHFDSYTNVAIRATDAAKSYGVNGSGVSVAVIDSGVTDHMDERNLNNTYYSRVVYSQSFVPNDPSTADAYGHGTHVAGIIAGSGWNGSRYGYGATFAGVANGAKIVNLRVLDANGAGSDSSVIAAIQRAIQLKNTYNIRVINLSVGRPIRESYKLDPLCQAVEQAWASGIVVVTAAGNNGRYAGTKGYGTITSPGNDPYVITVGATNTMYTSTLSDDHITSYSSKGPSAIDHIVKPDLVAPGNGIYSLDVQGSTIDVNYSSLTVKSLGGSLLNLVYLPLCTSGLNCQAAYPNSAYLRLNGTSMAAPAVSGAVALLLQKNPNLTNNQVKFRLMKTAWKGFPQTSTFTSDGVTYTLQNDIFTVGAGLLDIKAAMDDQSLSNGIAASPIAVLDPTTAKLKLQNITTADGSIVWGSDLLASAPDSVVWGTDLLSAPDSVVWGTAEISGPDSVVWGTDVLLSIGIPDSVVWGTSTLDSVVWGTDTLLSGPDSVVWGTDTLASPDSVVWGTTDLSSPDSVVWGTSDTDNDDDTAPPDLSVPPPDPDAILVPGGLQ